MDASEWSKLKSGTDIRGVASEGAPDGQAINLTDEVVGRIAEGFVLWLLERTGKRADALKIAVGRDSRLSGPRIKKAVVGALEKAGCTVFDCAMSSTPAMFMTTIDLSCEGAIQITASHHPFYRNGLKFFTRDGGLDGPDIDRILDFAARGEAPKPSVAGSVMPFDYMANYAARLRRMICDGVDAVDYLRPLTGFRIVVDAGNGAGGFYATRVLAPLGADITGSQFLDPDGRFPNHVPNPEDEQAMKSVCQATVKAKADLGVIFDTDVDRAGAVDASGGEINRNRLVALAAAIALERTENGIVVTDSITSSGLKEFIEKELGGVHHRFKRGYRNVINEAQRLCDEGENAPLAIETSGHAALRENYFLDDGAYLITRIIIKMAQLRKQGRTLDDLIASLREPAEAVELRFPIAGDDFSQYGDKVVRGLMAYASGRVGWQVAPDNREGIRVSIDADHGDGWFLLRLSVHDPLMPLNIESDRPGGCRIIARELADYLLTCDRLDRSSLQDYLSR